MTKKFYNMTLQERLDALKPQYNQDLNQPLSFENVDTMIENAIGIYEIPLGVAQHFVINGKKRTIPMATEEPSVIAAASKAAKMLGNIASATLSHEMIGECIFDRNDALETYVRSSFSTLLEVAQQAHPSIVKRGGGLRRIDVKHTEHFTILHALIDTKEAMGANMVNTIMEALSNHLESAMQLQSHLNILSNLSLRSLVQASVHIPMDPEIGQAIHTASLIAQEDVYRAVTHNKGIMNGISAVVLATGNDTRAVEAGAHAYASLKGQYQPLSTWTYQDHALSGTIVLPIAVGTVGGTIKNHPKAQLALELLEQPTKIELMEIIAAVGLAQNFAALYALTTTGIQKGHMKLQLQAMCAQLNIPKAHHALIIETMIQNKTYAQSDALKLYQALKESL